MSIFKITIFITKYGLKNYKRILACISRGLTPKDTAFAAKVSESLAYEYFNLVSENQVDIKKQKMLNEEVDYDDIPF